MLELICCSFVMITNRLLGEHVIDDVYAGNESESKGVPKTNTSVERDFGMLDRVMRIKPSASNYALESVIMYKKNNTGKWLKEMDEDKRKKFMEMARKHTKVQREEYSIRAKKIWDKEKLCRST